MMRGYTETVERAPPIQPEETIMSTEKKVEAPKQEPKPKADRPMSQSELDKITGGAGITLHDTNSTDIGKI
jgi:hypothetical protein